MDPDQFLNTTLETLNPDFKGAVVCSYDEYLYINKLNHRNFTFVVCNELIGTVPVVFYMQQKSYLTEAINEKIEHLKTAGLIEYWVSLHLVSDFVREQEPRVLTIFKLSGAFQLLAIGIAFSLIFFTGEVSFGLVRKLRCRKRMEKQ